MKKLFLAFLLPAFLYGGEITVDAAKPHDASRRDDVAQIKQLALAVGTEFGVERVAAKYLKSLKIHTLRLINVGISGQFDSNGNYINIKPSRRLEHALKLCRDVGANPHIIIHGIPEQLTRIVEPELSTDKMLGIEISRRRTKIGPTDYKKLENWYLNYFEYIKIRQGFKDAVFEIFNEPDIGGLIYPTAKAPVKGSRAAYTAMLNMYRAASSAGKRFEAKYPGRKLKLGGPAVTLAYSFKFAPLNWSKQFVIDCAKEDLKLDFLGIHHYASVSPIRGKSRTGFTSYAPFAEMLTEVQDTIAKHKPGLPVYLTEYGAHHNVVSYRGVGIINGDHRGAAFNMDFLDVMLEQNIAGAIALITCDMLRNNRNLFSWCSFLMGPGFYGYPYPKAPYHTYKMISELAGRRVRAERKGGNTRAFAAYDSKSKTLRVILWNYKTYIPEGKTPIDETVQESVKLSVSGFPLNGKAILRIVDRDHGDVSEITRKNRIPNLKTCLPEIRELTAQRQYDIVMNPGSVAMLEIGPNPTVPDLKTKFPEAAELLLKKGDIESLNKVSGIPGVQPEQKFDALEKLLKAHQRKQKTAEAVETSKRLIAFCGQHRFSVPFSPLKQLADSEAKSAPDKAEELYRKALTAQDIDWRGKAGTSFALEDLLIRTKQYDDAVKFCDETLAGDLPEEIRAEFAIRKMNIYFMVQDDAKLLAAHKQFLKMKSTPNAKVTHAMILMTYYRNKGETEKAVEAGEKALQIKGALPGLTEKLKIQLKQLKK